MSWRRWWQRFANTLAKPKRDLTPEERLAEQARLEFIGARKAALEAAVGHLITLDVSSELLTEIVKGSGLRGENIVRFAAQVVLHERGMEWNYPPDDARYDEVYEQALQIERMLGDGDVND